MSILDGQTIRQVILETIDELSRSGPSLQLGSIINLVQKRLEVRNDLDAEQAILTFVHDLFRTGYLAWGYNLSNIGPPHCHLTSQGRRVLENLSRDPANPDGYLKYLLEIASINPIAKSYIFEALNTYNSDCYKASAIMIGVAAESIILEMRDRLVKRIEEEGEKPSKKLIDWKMKNVIGALKAKLDEIKDDFPPKLAEAYESNWSALIHPIRTARNEAGHPVSIESITRETVHASLLIYPELAKVAYEIIDWVDHKD